MILLSFFIVLKNDGNIGDYIYINGFRLTIDLQKQLRQTSRSQKSSSNQMRLGRQKENAFERKRRKNSNKSRDFLYLNVSVCKKDSTPGNEHVQGSL